MTRDEIGERFRTHLLEIIERRGLTEAALSLQAGLNRRFITDLREGKVRSPKLSNAYAIAEALHLDVRDIIAGRDRQQVNEDLAELLGAYTPAQQERLLAAVRLLSPPPDEEP